jgi:crotonobetainyl-CoA:carnitine CoA-transferase CaiB-like acyl-CoA transferase
MSPAALDGLLVADFTRVLAGPLCSQTLGDLGADVVKVERPGSGDDTRAWGPPFAEQGASYYLGLNRNKRSLVLDLGVADDLALARELCARADVVLESFRPGTMDRFELGFDDVRALNPRAVYGSISGFGSGPAGGELPGYDLLLQAMGGLMSVTGEPDPGGRPLKAGAALVDMISGLYLTSGVLAALLERERSGEGQHVEVSLMDGALSALLNQGSGYLTAGAVPGRMGNRHPSIAPYETFAARDGQIAVAVGNDAMFVRLCEVLEQPQLAADERFATNEERIAHRDELAAEIERALAGADAAAWAERMTAAGVPAGPVNDVAAAYALAERLGLEPVTEIGGVRTARSPLRMGRTPVVARRPPPALGEHDAELRAWLSAGAPAEGE